MRRYAAKVDSNQPEIVAALRRAGCSVTLLHAVGQGCPDIVVGWVAADGTRDLTFMEIKDPTAARRSKAKELTPAQEDWHAAWRGRPVPIVETVAQALAVVGVEVPSLLPPHSSTPQTTKDLPTRSGDSA